MRAAARRGLLVLSVAALGVAAWSFWPVPAKKQARATPTQSETAIPVPRSPPDTGLPADPPPLAATPAPPKDGGEPEPDLDWYDPAMRDRLVEAARRHCTWPPHPTSWYVLDEPCETALNGFFLTDDWRRVLDNPVGTRHAVTAAFENPECRPHGGDPGQASQGEWLRLRGEPRPELREACAADAMARLADLQHKCIERLHQDWTRIYDKGTESLDRIATEKSYTQERYHRLVQDEHYRYIRICWETHMCRSVRPAAFEWVDALPEPPGDPAAPRYNRPPISQWLLLYDAAERLGADIPEKVSHLLASDRQRELSNAR